MNIDLNGKTAVVTGSTQGIGLAAAKGLAAAGAQVTVNGRHQDKVDEAVAFIKDEVGSHAEVAGMAADLGTDSGCRQLLNAVPECDILVNNVGIFGPEDFFSIKDSEWQRFFDVNIMSGVRLSRGYVEKMAEKGWGRVVFLSSESGLNIPADMIHYGFTKTAVLSISRGLAKRMAGTGVTVNSVLPGPTKSEGVQEMMRDIADNGGKNLDEAGKAFVMANRPTSIIQRMAEVEEVANMIVYACSPQASATTGAALRVDGGVVDSIA